MFYKTGVDVTNDKQMFNFLKEHPTYYVANPNNIVESIAHDVKLYKLGLSGDWGIAYALLANGEYETLNWMIQQWCDAHPGFEVYFNGRSGGHLVLASASDHANSVLVDDIVYCNDYEEYKEYCKECYGSVKANRSDLVFYTKLVQDFDKLCDRLRDYCDELSNQKFEVVAMEIAVADFNSIYYDDLEVMEFDYLRCDDEGIVDLSEIIMLKSLTEAFLRFAQQDGYNIEWLTEAGAPTNKVKLVAM
jgi:hypothetical protein